jgi:anti-sigma B factor antagonist
VGDPHVARLEGEIDLSNAAGLGAEIAAALGGAGGLVVDLSAVTYFDSTGMRMLDSLVGACQEAGIRLCVVAPDRNPARFVLRICAWPDGMLAETVEDAVARVS